jgi:hypothetical protein
MLTIERDAMGAEDGTRNSASWIDDGDKYDNGEINVRSQDDYEPAIPSAVRHYPPVTLAELQLAAKLAEQIAALEVGQLNGGHWRLFRVFHLSTHHKFVRIGVARMTCSVKSVVIEHELDSVKASIVFGPSDASKEAALAVPHVAFDAPLFGNVVRSITRQ